jgi:broad specificity phosphatase PhoE
MRKAGAVTLVRHGEPALSRRTRLDAQGYRDWWATYEEGGLKSGQSPPDRLVERAAAADVVMSSIRRRSIESARAVTGGAPFAAEAMFVEAPLPPPRFPAWIRLPPRWWGVIARTWWWAFDHHEGQESRSQAEARARAAAQALSERAARGEEVVVIAHGFFNLMIGKALMSMGWRRTLDEGFRYWCARRFEPPAAAPALAEGPGEGPRVRPQHAPARP